MSTKALNLYFYEKVNNAKKHQKFSFSNETTSYLSDLLTQSAMNSHTAPVYLVDMYEASINSSGKEAFLNYKKLGDYTLITSGYFPESLYSRSVSLEYYIDMGVMAYSNISKRSNVYLELANSYRNFVSILNEVSEEKFKTPENIYKLYSLWMQTNNNDIKNKLIRLGVVITDIEV